MKHVILTFDDGFKSHHKFVFPLLKQTKCKGTFFICTRIIRTLTQMLSGEIMEMHRAGFEIGHHFATHIDITKLTEEAVHTGITAGNRSFNRWHITGIQSFCPPGYHYNQFLKKLLETRGFKYVRVGCNDNTKSYLNGGIGPILKFKELDPYEINCTVIGPSVSLVDAIDQVNRTDDESVAVFCFHDFDENVGTSWPKERFTKFIQYIASHNIKTINLNELGKYKHTVYK